MPTLPAVAKRTKMSPPPAENTRFAPRVPTVFALAVKQEAVDSGREIRLIVRDMFEQRYGADGSLRFARGAKAPKPDYGPVELLTVSSIPVQLVKAIRQEKVDTGRSVEATMVLMLVKRYGPKGDKRPGLAQPR